MPRFPKITKKFLLYVFFSGFAALVNFASRFLYETVPGVNFEFAVALAYLTGMLVNFAFSKWITFQAGASGRFRREAIKFFLVAAMGLVVTVLVSAGALRALEILYESWSDWPMELDGETLETLAHLAGMAAGLLMNFVGHELLSFRETGIWDRMRSLLTRPGKEGN
jgi:putative flippase GtrA